MVISNVSIISVLISAPSDIEKEIEIVEEVIAQWNRLNCEKEGKILRTKHWTRDVTPGAGQPQEIINQQIVGSSDILIAFFRNRIGTPTDKFVSGTVEEIEHFCKSGKPTLVYFSNEAVSLAEIDVEQLKKLQDYKREIRDRFLIYHYHDLVSLKTKLLYDIDQTVLKFSAQESDRHEMETEQETSISEFVTFVHRFKFEWENPSAPFFYFGSTPESKKVHSLLLENYDKLWKHYPKITKNISAESEQKLDEVLKAIHRLISIMESGQLIFYKEVYFDLKRQIVQNLDFILNELKPHS